MDTIRRLAVALLLAASVSLPAFAQDAPMNINGAKTLNGQQVVDLVSKTPDIVIFDNRQQADFANGHIEGAVRMLDTDTNAEALAKHLKAKASPALFYCNGLKCGRAAKAAEIAVKAGYTNVYYYALGMDEWRQLGLPLVR